MKTLTVIGSIFTLIGIVVLLFGFAKMSEVSNAYNQLGVGQYLGSLGNTLAWTLFEPYLIGAVVCFVIGGVGLYAGSSQNSKNYINQIPETQVYNDGKVSVSVTTGHTRSTLICDSCGTVNDTDALFCKKCGNRFKGCMF